MGKESKLPSFYISSFDFVTPAAESKTQQKKQTRGDTNNDVCDGTRGGHVHLHRINFYF